MQLTRMTTRRLMLVVLVVAALLTAFEAGRQWERAKRAKPSRRIVDAMKLESSTR